MMADYNYVNWILSKTSIWFIPHFPQTFNKDSPGLYQESEAAVYNLLISSKWNDVAN